MTKEQFTYWLKGRLENVEKLNKKDIEEIKSNLEAALIEFTLTSPVIYPPNPWGENIFYTNGTDITC